MTATSSTIKYVAEVSDGHGHAGAQELTITLVGADSPPDGPVQPQVDGRFVFAEAEQGPVVVNGTPGDDVIHATSANDVLTGGAGADQFVFAPEAEAQQPTRSPISRRARTTSICGCSPTSLIRRTSTSWLHNQCGAEFDQSGTMS